MKLARAYPSTSSLRLWRLPMRCAILLPALIVMGASHAVAQSQPRTEVLEHWRRATFSLGKLDASGRDYSTVIIAALDERHPCILTAKHVIFDPNKSPAWKPAELRLRPPRNASSPTPDLGVAVPLIVNGRNTWKSLSDGSDLAVIPGVPNLSIYSDLHGIAVSDFGATEDDVFQGASVLVLGYPGAVGESRLSFPIARSGIVAWTDPSNRLDRRFIIDANMLPGNSGGPVFRLRTGMDRFGNFVVGGGLALIGIMAQALQEKQSIVVTSPPVLGQIGTQTTSLEFQVSGIGAIGIVEPASKAKALVQQYCVRSQ